ncbi:hypothetical protein [Natronorubrum sp. DTA28]|uniref:hypothetical protein n=1 Tax=Natronorubrum sp. DTA28 TaxID=3447019 RepID=UPI003F855925
MSGDIETAIMTTLAGFLGVLYSAELVAEIDTLAHAGDPATQLIGMAVFAVSGITAYLGINKFL